ncbi:MAG: hypothetical protein HKN00_05900 [Flavobacteriaceae bacterium]|nr:hypothetical protein [Bacteroidia bacterium]NNF74697.1 hypothetical protein [Flavobacteriaceae bacterium]NNK72193.1 hypothetical protein [Flavobacteriaceae bacterium]
MKALVKIFFFMAVLSLVAGCEKTEPIEFEQSTSLETKAPTGRPIGFNVVMTGNYDYVGPSDICGDFPPYARVINSGEGTGSHLGHFTHYFDFCFDTTDGSYPEDYIEGYFEDENGDRLFVEVAGFVIPGRLPGMPNFAVSYFKDPWVIIGGTGRFEGATGYGMTNDYNSAKDPYSHHNWKGRIILQE